MRKFGGRRFVGLILIAELTACSSPGRQVTPHSSDALKVAWTSGLQWVDFPASRYPDDQAIAAAFQGINRVSPDTSKSGSSVVGAADSGARLATGETAGIPGTGVIVGAEFAADVLGLAKARPGYVTPEIWYLPRPPLSVATTADDGLATAEDAYADQLASIVDVSLQKTSVAPRGVGPDWLRSVWIKPGCAKPASADMATYDPVCVGYFVPPPSMSSAVKAAAVPDPLEPTRQVWRYYTTGPIRGTPAGLFKDREIQTWSVLAASAALPEWEYILVLKSKVGAPVMLNHGRIMKFVDDHSRQ